MSDFITNSSDLSGIRRLHIHEESYADRRMRERQQAKQAEQKEQKERTASAAAQQAQAQQWQQWFHAALGHELDTSLCELIGTSVGEVIGEVHKKTREEVRAEFAPRITALEERIKQLENLLSLDNRFKELERDQAPRQAALDKARKGAKGERGERGARGERGPAGARGPAGKPAFAMPTITAFKVDPKAYRIICYLSNGQPGPVINLHALYQRFFNECAEF